MAYDPPRVRRVPPPPPPGFGDDEYYRLYGRPEDYHKYRQQLEDEQMFGKEPSKLPYPPHQREDYYSYREYQRSRKDDIDYYYGSSRGRVSPNEARRPPPRSHNRQPDREATPELSSLEEEDLSPANDLRKSQFENFRVTIRNESDGTPSLSGMDENTDISNDDNTDTDSDVLSEEEESEEDEEEDELSDEPVRPKSVVAKKDRKPPSPPPPQPEPKPRISVKDRLGIRRSSPEVLKSRNNRDADRKGDAEKSRAATAKRNRTPPAPTLKRDENLSPAKRRQRQTSVDKKLRERETSRDRGSKIASRTSRPDRRGSSIARRRDSHTDRNQTRTRTPPPTNSAKRKKSRNSRRAGTSGIGGASGDIRAKMESTQKENELMLRRLARKRKGQYRISESDKNMTLARMAGIEIPAGTLGLPEKLGESKSRRDRRDEKKRSRSRSQSSPEKSKFERKKTSSRDRSRDKRVSRSASSRDNRRSRSGSRDNRSSRNKRPKSPSRFATNRFAAAKKKLESRKKSPARRDETKRGKRSRERVTGLESAAAKSRRSKLLLSRSRSRSRSRTSTVAPRNHKEGNGASGNGPGIQSED